ncbi:E3 ubiquitin-protein ligase RNF213 [Pelomyxa schiedti]|nr:E3 ubiquitin-protein ligase RNF213 [Pelomyxa schiedti]
MVKVDESFARCDKCKRILCNLCMRKIPTHKGSEISYLRRLFSLVVSQLRDFAMAFETWEYAESLEEGQFIMQLAFHFSKMILNCSINLAKPAMQPFDKLAPQDDIQRCTNMEKFEQWREMPFFVVTQQGYHITSTAAFSPLHFIKNAEMACANRSPAFLEWLTVNECVLHPINRAYLQKLCFDLGQKPYSIDQENPPLKILLEVIGCFQGARPVLDVLSTLTRGKTVGTVKLCDVIDRVSTAVKYLESTGTKIDTNMSCAEFMTICSSYLIRLFGDGTQKPTYTLTVDNILRIMSVQIRLFAGIPVCIMGETGCGKTETIQFLSSISGQTFNVINVQEGISEEDFFHLMQPIIEKATGSNRQHVVLLDEVNTTSALWTAKDMLCDHICFGVRVPSNIVFIAILNPWKLRTEAQNRAIAEMDVGGLDFLRYQQNTSKGLQNQPLNLVYQVHHSPETLYSLAWDWGTSATTETPLCEVSSTLAHTLVIQGRDNITDELLMASSMVSWLINKLDNIQVLRNDFKQAGDGTQGEAFWIKFRTLLVDLLLTSQDFIRHDVYLDEISVVSLRDIRKGCELVALVFETFWCQVRAKLQEEQLVGPFPYFRFLTNAVHIALVSTYCLRLDSSKRLSYLIRVQTRWNTVRGWFPGLNPNFMPGPPPASLAASYDSCELYQSFNEFATYLAQDLDIEGGLAVNQALKENCFAVLCAVCTTSTLFIVGRPGSTKSRTLELLVKATEDRREESFLGKLNIVIQKHVIQCSPYTTAHHVHSNARRAALAQNAANKIALRGRRIVVLVLEEVGATIGSIHNPLMSLHSMIDHGINVDGKAVRLPIIGVSNYRLDASKMGRGRVVYRGNPPVNDLEITAKAILRGLGQAHTAGWITNFSFAFSQNILRNESMTWYFGMRDFYSTVSTIRILAVPIEQSLHLNQIQLAQSEEINSHITRWAVLINLRGFPDQKQEELLSEATQSSFGLLKDVIAKWEWKRESGDVILLCDCCCKMQLYYETIKWRSTHPSEDFSEETVTLRFKEHAAPVSHQAYCQYFTDLDIHNIPAPEVISYSLYEVTSRHTMIFTKANAALMLLFSMGLVQKEQSTVIFQSTGASRGATTTSELVQQMMRIKACLREGKTLILVKSRHLYESLLDALNVHYYKDRSFSNDDSDALHKTMLSMAGVTQAVFVRPSFRCIVLEDQEELKSSVLPPMINRFSKTILTYASALSPSQRKCRSIVSLKGSCQISDGKVVNLFEFLIPGFKEESLDSAVYAFSEQDEVMKRLCYCFSRKNLRRLSLNLVQGLDSPAATITISSLNHIWKLSGCNLPFKELSQLALQDRHLMIITEQLQVSVTALVQEVTQLFKSDESTMVTLEPPNMIILNQATSSEVHSALTALKRVPTDDNRSAFSIFILDTSSPQSVLLDAFMYAVSSETLTQHQHVVLIVVVSDFMESNSAKIPFSLLFDRTWAQVFADEVVPHSMAGKPWPSLLGDLDRELYLHEILTEDLITALALENDNLTTICQSIAASASEVNPLLEFLQQLLKGTSFSRSLVEIILENTKHCKIEFSKWHTLAFQKAKYSSDSLCTIYVNYLGGFVVRVLVILLHRMVQFHSLQLLDVPEMMELVSRLILSSELTPRCDIESCLNLNPLPTFQCLDVESNNGALLFPKQSRTCQGKLTTVSFPLSPFIAKHLSDLEGNTNEMEQFIQSAGLDTVNPKCLSQYFEDVLCIGAGFEQQRLGLLEKVLKMSHQNAFGSIVEFHKVIAENPEWFKFLLQFCMLDFSPELVNNFSGNTVEDLLPLASVDGIVPLNRIELLAELTKYHHSINWGIVRAMSMVASKDQRKESRNALVKLYEIFANNEAEGVNALLKGPDNFIKYFLFELFSTDDPKESLIISALQFIIHTPLNDPKEGLLCGTAFLLRRAFSMLYQQPSPTGELAACLTKFITADHRHYILAVHCAFDAIYLGNLDDGIIEKFSSKTPLNYFIRMVLVTSLLIDLHNCEEPAASHPVIMKLLQNDVADTREAALFVLRCGSAAGTVEIAKAISRIRAGKYPQSISQCPVVDELAKCLQMASPLACKDDFTDAVSLLCEYSVQQSKQTLDRFKALSFIGKASCVGAFCLDVAPQHIDNFSSAVFPILQGDFSAEARTLFKSLSGSLIRQKDVQVRILTLCLVSSILGGHKIMKFFQDMAETIRQSDAILNKYRPTIEDLMNPRCPRCKAAFVDWDGCFAFTCSNKNCKCGFCGHCLLDCGKDAHSHLRQKHGGYFGDRELFRREFGVIATTEIRRYIQTIPREERGLVEAALPNILKGNIFNVRADQIVSTLKVDGSGEDSPPIVEAFIEILSCAGHLWNRLTVANSGADSLESIFAQISDQIKILHNSLFHASSKDCTFLWLHAMIWKVENIALSGEVTRALVKDNILQLCRQYKNPLTLLSEFDKQTKRTSSDALLQLKLTEGDLLSKPFNESCQRSLLMLARSRFSFKHQFWSHLKENYVTYPLLNLLGEKKSSLESASVSAVYGIIKFLHKLQQCCKEKAVTRAFAEEEGSFFGFIQNYGEPLKSSVVQFQTNFLTVFNHVSNWQCQTTIQTTFAHMKREIPVNTKLACFLPQSKGLGILSMALWSGTGGDKPGSWVGVPHIQNNIYDLIHGSDAPKVCGNPYLLLERDLISVDCDFILDIVKSLFLVPGYQSHLSSDLVVAESLCKFGSLRFAFYLSIASELPEYNYGMEGLLTLYTQLQESLEREHRYFSALTPSIFGQVKSLIQREPHISESIFSFCGAVLLQVSDRLVPNTKGVVSIAMDMPLTNEQKLGQQVMAEMPSVATAFHLEHLPAMMGLCWNHKVHPSADQKIASEADIAEIEETLKYIVDTPLYHVQISAILTSLRVTGVCNFLNEITDAFAKTPLSFFLTVLTNAPAPAEDRNIERIRFYDDDTIMGRAPFALPVKYYGHILRQAEAILGPHETTGTAVSESCIVPFSAMRQFLRDPHTTVHAPELISMPLGKNAAIPHRQPPGQVVGPPAVVVPAHTATISVTSSLLLDDLEL